VGSRSGLKVILHFSPLTSKKLIKGVAHSDAQLVKDPEVDTQIDERPRSLFFKQEFVGESKWLS